MTLASRGKSSLLAALSALTRRHAILLPQDASSEHGALNVAAPYRVTLPAMSLDILERSPGSLSVSLLAYEGHFPRLVLWDRSGIDYGGPASLMLDLTNGLLRLGPTTLGKADLPPAIRRFAIRLKLRLANGKELSRITGHYVAATDIDVGESYYRGSDYVDYEAEARGEVAEITRLLENHHALDPILEIGSATGVIFEQLEKAGRNVTGVDFSPWAVEQATQRLGNDKVFVADVEHDDLPVDVQSRGPFGTLLLWAVLEHFHDPFAVLAKLCRYATADATLIINTTNSASLSHHLFGNDWEGYFDWTHHGVDAVSITSLRRELPLLGWKIEEIYTHSFWHAGADPDHAVLRETFAYDARFSRLLRGRDFGDFVVCVARRHASAG